jgi:hypothetical protein
LIAHVGSRKSVNELGTELGSVVIGQLAQFTEVKGTELILSHGRLNGSLPICWNRRHHWSGSLSLALLFFLRVSSSVLP